MRTDLLPVGFLTAESLAIAFAEFDAALCWATAIDLSRIGLIVVSFCAAPSSGFLSAPFSRAGLRSVFKVIAKARDRAIRISSLALLYCLIYPLRVGQMSLLRRRPFCGCRE